MAGNDKKDVKISQTTDLPDLKLIEISEGLFSNERVDAKPLKRSAIADIHKLILENVRLFKEQDNADTA